MKKEIWADCRKNNLEESYRLYGATGIFGKRSTDIIYKIKSDKDIENIHSDNEYLFVEFSDWKVIPAENLLAKFPDKKIIVKTNNIGEMKTLATTLEKGVSGFLVDEESILLESCSLYKPDSRLKLVNGIVKSVREIEKGKRVCIDGIMTYKPREGLLVGFLSGFMFLTDGETSENPYINTREWRVNAGAASLYALCRRDNKITPRLLDDLMSGDEIIVADADGQTRTETIGRVKKEWRPMTFIQAEHLGRVGSTCSQTAETVRLVTPEGTKPVTEIKVGDKIKLYVTEPVATHAGRPVDERIIEI